VGRQSAIDVREPEPGPFAEPRLEDAFDRIARNPTAVVTDLGTYDFDGETGEMTLSTMHPGVTIDVVRANMGWEPKVAPDLGETDRLLACDAQTSGGLFVSLPADRATGLPWPAIGRLVEGAPGTVAVR